jgi:protein pelota
VETTASLHISGPVAEENQHVSMGSHHTLDIEAHRDIRIQKEDWDSVALGRVEESCVPGRGAEVAAVVCGEGALPCIIYNQNFGLHLLAF